MRRLQWASIGFDQRRSAYHAMSRGFWAALPQAGTMKGASTLPAPGHTAGHAASRACHDVSGRIVVLAENLQFDTKKALETHLNRLILVLFRNWRSLE
jgi:hypothetical protein